MINYRKVSSLISLILILSFFFIPIKAKAIEYENQDLQRVENGQDVKNDENTDKNKLKQDVIEEKKETKSDDNAIESNNEESDEPEQNIDKTSNIKDNADEVEENSINKEKIPEYQWKKVNGKLYYYIKGKLYTETGWFKESDVNSDASEDAIYYLIGDGYAATGWKQFGDEWYYFNDKGIMQTGKQLIKNVWYYLDKFGKMKTGWIKEKSDKYYFTLDGGRAVGKKLIDNKWYYFGITGKLQVGRYYNNNKLYYSDKNGVMVSDKWITIGDSDYYIKADSSFAIGQVIIDGKLEIFDKKGKHIDTEDIDVPYVYVKQLSVGDADCAFIKLQNGETVLIDTGTNETSEKLVSFLKDQELKKDGDKYKINYIVITHAHSDHIGGLRALLENFSVDKVYMPKYAVMKNWASGIARTEENKDDLEMLRYDYKVYKDAVKAMKEYNMKFTDTIKGRYIDKANVLQFVQSDVFFGPVGPDKLTSNYWGINDDCAIVYLNYGDLQMLFTGDMEWTSEKNFVNNDLLNGRKVDVLKVCHHGHDTSSTANFLRYVNPEIGIISRSKESIEENTAYKNLINQGISLYETSSNDGVSIYATIENWTVGKK